MDESNKIWKNYDAKSNTDSNSEIEGFLCEQIYEYTCKAIDHNKTSQIHRNDPLQNSDSSDTRFPTGHLNISSDSHHSISDSIKNLNSSLSNDDEIKQTIAEEPPPKRGKKRSTIRQPSELVNQKCCSEDCLTIKLTIQQIEFSRTNFVTRFPTYEKQRQFLIDWFTTHEYTPGEFSYEISGISTCCTAWRNVLGITRRTFYRLKTEFKHGLRVADHGATGTLKHSLKNEYVSLFLEKYVMENGENMPNSRFVHLSSSITWRDIYSEMVQTLTAQGREVCSENYFNQIRKREFSHVKIPKENRMGKCDYCTKIKDELKKTRDTREREQILQKRKQHKELMRAERKCYHERAAKGHQSPHQFFSMAIDGMDQNKTELPYSKLCYKGLDGVTKLRVHIVASMIHGRPPLLFLDWRQFRHDSNLTMNIILQVLWANRELLADEIYLQLDNTAKENKNQFVFSFIAFLVKAKVFKRFEVCFLKPGHTHLDADQLFSRLSVGIASLGCLTFNDLIKLIRNCYKQTGGTFGEEGAIPQWIALNHLFAIREWLEPYMCGLHNLRQFYHFAFVIENEEVVMHYKQWSSEKWDEKKYPPLKILKGLPSGVPCLIKPDYEAVELKKLENMVDKSSEIGAFQQEKVEQWKEFLSEEVKKAEMYEKAELVDLGEHTVANQIYLRSEGDRWAIDDLLERDRPQEPLSAVSSVLENFSAKERGDGLVQVYTGAYIRTKEVQKGVIEEASLEEIGVGDLVAVECENYKEELPLIAKVLKINAETLEIEWYTGGWKTSWKPAKKRSGKQMIPWTDTIPKESIKLFDFTLTGGNKLRKATMERLKEAYGLQDV